VRTLLRSISEAIRFLTIIPVPGKPPEKKTYITAVYPVAGLLIGIIISSAAYAVSFLPFLLLNAVIIVSVKITVTGGLHYDGLADLSDGLGGFRSRERRLEIMKDSRVGSFGVIAVVLMIMLQISAVYELLNGNYGVKKYYVLISAPVLSRGLIPLVMKLFRSARKEGMGAENKNSTGLPSVIISAASVFIIIFLLNGPAGIVVFAAVSAVILFSALYISRILGGLTGDVYGALIEFADFLVIFISLILYNFLK